MEVMFVDDTNLLLSHKSIDTLFSSTNVKLGNVSTWSSKLSLIVDKTKWLLFHPVSKKTVTTTDLP